MERKREGNFTFLEGNSTEKKDKNQKFYFAEVEALGTTHYRSDKTEFYVSSEDLLPELVEYNYFVNLFPT